MSIASLFIPFAIAGILSYGFIKRVNVFDCFVRGARKGMETAVSLLPVLVGLVFAVSLFSQSGAVEVITRLLSPLFSLAGIPEEIIPLCIVSPVSGSGSLAVFEDILSRFGVDSYAGRVASVIAGSTETTFYALAIYLGSVGIKKYGALIPCALIGDIASFITASFAVRVFMQ